MKKLKKSHSILIVISLLMLFLCIGMTVYLLFSNYQNVHLFKQAQNNFLRGDSESLQLAETQLLQVISHDSDNEAAYVMLGEIAGRKKIYPEQIYYCYMAHRLNPLSAENKTEYIQSLCLGRYFDRLENFLSQQQILSVEEKQILLYAAGRNKNINKYKSQLDRRDNDNRIGELAFLLFKHDHLSNKEKLFALNKFKSSGDAFLQQEILAAEAELYFAMEDYDNTEKALEQACKLNEFAFAPALGRFYARYRSFGKALTVLEKYLSLYHDPIIAMQTAEIYCLLDQTDKIAKLRDDFQADSGNIAMVSCYYFDALTALAKNDMTALKEFTAPLRKSIDTPLADFMFLCIDLQSDDVNAVRASYSALISKPNYLDLQKRADSMVLDYFKRALSKIESKEDQLGALATMLYGRNPDAFTAKFILLEQKKKNTIDVSLLKDALTRFSNDQGVLKIAIEYFLNNDFAACERLIACYKQSFPNRAGDMLRYEIVIALKMKDFKRASDLFQKNFLPEMRGEYWTFASATGREQDLQFLAQDKLYEPYCKALMFLKKNDSKSACDLLEKADANGNLPLLFFAAKTLAENGRNQAAIRKYLMFPENSPYRLEVLLNMSELFAESGNLPRALELARQAYTLAPGLPETRLCYADKLYRSGNLIEIPDIIKSVAASRYRKEMEKLWVAGMQVRLQKCDINTQQSKLRELCRQLLVIDPDNRIALDLLKKIKKKQQ